MKLRGMFFFIGLLMLVVVLFSACDEAGKEDFTISMAGFIEIRDNMLYIRPVEVFVQYVPGNVIDEAFGLGAVTYVDINDAEQMAVLGLSVHDFPSGLHIRPNWHADAGWYYVERANIEVFVFEIGDDVTFTYRGHTTNDLEEFLPHLYPAVVHFIEVSLPEGRLIRLVQEFWLTM